MCSAGAPGQTQAEERGHLLWALLAVDSPAGGWRKQDLGKGILKKDDWLALAAVSVFIVMAAQLVSLWLWGISPCDARADFSQDQGKAANHSRGSPLLAS